MTYTPSTQAVPPGDPDDYVLENRLKPRRRRSIRALNGLGISSLVGQDWISVVDGRFHFADLDPDTFERLVNRLEELAGPALVNPAPAESFGREFWETTFVQGTLDLPTEPAVLTAGGWWS